MRADRIGSRKVACRLSEFWVGVGLLCRFTFDHQFFRNPVGRKGLRLSCPLSVLVKPPCFKKMAGAATRRRRRESLLLYYVVVREIASAKSRRNSSSAKEPQCHPPPITYPDADPISYSGGFVQPAPFVFFRKSVPCITVATAHNFSAHRALRGIPVSLNALPPRHAIVGCISTNFKHHPTLNNTICATGRSQTATICMQK